MCKQLNVPRTRDLITEQITELVEWLCATDRHGRWNRVWDWDGGADIVCRPVCVVNAGWPPPLFLCPPPLRLRTISGGDEYDEYDDDDAFDDMVDAPESDVFA
jgi:hypothetical protein